MSNFANAEHAFLVGSLVGALMTGRFDALPVIDAEGDYEPMVEVRWVLGETEYRARLDVSEPTLEVVS